MFKQNQPLQPPLLFDETFFNQNLTNGNALTVFKDAIATADTYLNERFIGGAKIHDLIHERATFIDCILLRAWQQFDWDKTISLLAVGGYGRGELHPHSDIDLLILLKTDNTAPYQENIEKFLTFLWDIQLKIGHSVRSIQQCSEEAKADITVATNLMESRTLIGDPALKILMMEATSPAKIWPSEQFFRAKWDEQLARHHRHGDTEYNLEPNVKEAPGGLRDIQMINWVAYRHFGVNTMAMLVGKGFISEDELTFLHRGEAFLWKVRYGLHLLAKRPEERLTFDFQRKLAAMFGYQDNDERLAVEQFMQHYYRVVLDMRELNDVLLQYLDEVILSSDKSRAIRPINPRFQIRDNHIETVNDTVFERHPSAMIELFVLLGENPDIDGVRAATIRQLQVYRHLIDDAFRNDPANKALFLRLFSCPGKLSLQLRRMTRYGILGRYLPIFGRIIGQTQHDLFHIYPVDVHTLQLIRNMRRLDHPDDVDQFPIAAHIYKNLPKPELLFIAGLFHDVGKGRGGDHSALGAIDVAEFAEHHGLPSQEVQLLKWLVEKHLLMSSVSQREDISDPEVIQHFAAIVGDQIHLDYLLLLTICDIRGTNPSLWNSWRSSLISTLYLETKNALQRGLENPASRNEWASSTRADALRLLNNSGISSDTAERIWGDVGVEFFLREPARVIARCIRAIDASQNAEKPVIMIHDAGMEQAVATRIFIYTKGRNNVFPITAATLDQLGLTIQDARLNTASNGHTFDMFYVLDKIGKPIGHEPQKVQKTIDTLSDALLSPDDSVLTVKRWTSLRLKHFNLKTKVFLHNDTANSYTTLEVITPDRPGLLAHMGKIFMDFNIRLHSAKIATLGERVEDVFYLTDMNNNTLSDPDFCQKLQDTICNTLDTRNTRN